MTNRSLVALGWFVLAGGMVPLAGCTEETGTGTVTGQIFVIGCRDVEEPEEQDLGSAEALVPLDFKPSFFAGEPVPDLFLHREDSRLIIRLQSSGRPFEFNDTLVFDLLEVQEIARCMRGRKAPDGTPDYRPDLCTPLEGGRGARVYISSNGRARSYFMPRLTCSSQAFGSIPLVGVAARCPTERDDLCAAAPEASASWIDIVRFGGALPKGEESLAPEMRTPLGRSFKIDFGDNIHVSAFRLHLVDQRVTEAERTNRPPPDPLIGGILEGRFEFDLVRSQGAQAFP